MRRSRLLRARAGVLPCAPVAAAARLPARRCAAVAATHIRAPCQRPAAKNAPSSALCFVQVPKIFTAVFECTLQMITRNFEVGRTSARGGRGPAQAQLSPKSLPAGSLDPSVAQLFPTCARLAARSRGGVCRHAMHQSVRSRLSSRAACRTTRSTACSSSRCCVPSPTTALPRSSP